MNKTPLFFALAACFSTFAAAQDERTPAASSASARERIAPPRIGLLAVATPPLDSLEPSVRDQISAMQDSTVRVSQEPAAPPEELAEAYGLLAQLYHAYGFHDSAEDAYLNAIRLVPEFRWVHLLGYLYQQQGRLEQAEMYFLESLRLVPQYFPTRVRLGDIYSQLNRGDEAQEQYLKALEMSPESPSALTGLGELALALKEYEKAVDYLQRALSQIPEATRLHYSLGMAYRGLQDLENARAHLERAGTVGIKAPDQLTESLQTVLQGERVQLVAGKMAFQHGRYQEAARAFRLAIEASPNSAGSRVNLGATLIQLGDKTGAATQFREALRLDPENTTAHFNLGSLLMAEQKLNEALPHFQSVLAKKPEDPEASLAAARILAAQGEHQEALYLYLRVIDKEPELEDPVVEACRILVAYGKYANAIALLDRAIKANPRQPRAIYSLAKLLAACPDASLRDGARALELATSLYQAVKSLAGGELVAMAYAETGQCQRAADWQSRMITVAEHSGNEEQIQAMRDTLEHYQTEGSCRPPFQSDKASPTPGGPDQSPS